MKTPKRKRKKEKKGLCFRWKRNNAKKRGIIVHTTLTFGNFDSILHTNLVSAFLLSNGSSISVRNKYGIEIVEPFLYKLPDAAKNDPDSG